MNYHTIAAASDSLDVNNIVLCDWASQTMNRFIGGYSIEKNLKILNWEPETVNRARTDSAMTKKVQRDKQLSTKQQLNNDQHASH